MPEPSHPCYSHGILGSAGTMAASRNFRDEAEPWDRNNSGRSDSRHKIQGRSLPVEDDTPRNDAKSRLFSQNNLRAPSCHFFGKKIPFLSQSGPFKLNYSRSEAPNVPRRFQLRAFTSSAEQGFGNSAFPSFPPSLFPSFWLLGDLPAFSLSFPGIWR